MNHGFRLIFMNRNTELHNSFPDRNQTGLIICWKSWTWEHLMAVVKRIASRAKGCQSRMSYQKKSLKKYIVLEVCSYYLYNISKSITIVLLFNIQLCDKWILPSSDHGRYSLNCIVRPCAQFYLFYHFTSLSEFASTNHISFQTSF